MSHDMTIIRDVEVLMGIPETLWQFRVVLDSDPRPRMKIILLVDGEPTDYVMSVSTSDVASGVVWHFPGGTDSRHWGVFGEVAKCLTEEYLADQKIKKNRQEAYSKARAWLIENGTEMEEQE